MPIAQKLWEHFVKYAGLAVTGIHLQQITLKWRKTECPSKLRNILKIFPAVVLWELWKRRNARRHKKEVNLQNLIK